MKKRKTRRLHVRKHVAREKENYTQKDIEMKTTDNLIGSANTKNQTFRVTRQISQQILAPRYRFRSES